jgi:hypothetical protein
MNSKIAVVVELLKQDMALSIAAKSNLCRFDYKATMGSVTKSLSIRFGEIMRISKRYQTSSKKPWWISRHDDESQTGNAGSPGTPRMAGQIAGRIEFTLSLPHPGITLLGSPTDRVDGLK